ncbi:MAG: ATP-binding protein [Lachnospiraceae bacterium]|uniref:ATP-binding protein n=1 Tax=Candidatus Weimeria bifida TaxID=2599074 RepID=A0A6N7IXS4_9FIRM|nr:ATP-binding protein [Candidatus Weimeria bifida]RRF95103.1 MAG: ATP-binding protein [Lachnospiraceae bacterium]
MYKEIVKFISYGNIPDDSILYKLGDIFKSFEEGTASDAQLTREIYEQIHRLLAIATDYGFDGNLWQNYLTFLLITDENPFSITCEKTGANDGSVNEFAKNDFKAAMNLFHFDFGPIEKALGINVFTVITHYKAIVKKDLMYNHAVSEKVRTLSGKLASAKDENEFFNIVTDFYKAYGVGMFGLNKAFRISDKDGKVVFHPINNMEVVHLSDLVGYESQKKQLVENTEAFVEGRGANNCLLYGDSGTGKSTSIKAIVNEYYDRGLRMIEIYKHQMKDISTVISLIKNRNYRFIIYMDDLSFEGNETDYKYLKAVIEGGVETKPDNVLIYATSNRRHLIKEEWTDRNDADPNDIHKNDTVEEKLSLVNRFGCQINYSKPNQKEYFHIVKELAHREKIHLSDEELEKEANIWELRHNGMSGRSAQQFINYLKGLENI